MNSIFGGLSCGIYEAPLFEEDLEIKIKDSKIMSSKRKIDSRVY